MAPETAEERSIRLAEERGALQARIANRLDGHDRELKEMGRSLVNVDQELRNVNSGLHDLSEKVGKREEISRALASAAEKAVNKQVGRREFFLGLGTLMVMMGAAIATILTAHL